MRGKMQTPLGTIMIHNEVIATYAGSVAVECFGIVGMAAVNMKDGLVRLLKKDYLTHGTGDNTESSTQVFVTHEKWNHKKMSLCLC